MCFLHLKDMTQFSDQDKVIQQQERFTLCHLVEKQSSYRVIPDIPIY